MKQDLASIIAKEQMKGWKKIEIEFGKEKLNISVPPGCEELRMKPMPSRASSKNQILDALNNPIGSPKLGEIIKKKDKPVGELTVCVTVSDITRPVPYKGESGILRPLFEIIEGAGVKRENIVIVIGNGMHRPSTKEERIQMYGQDIVDSYRIVDHNCEDDSNLVLAANTTRGTEVYLNKVFYNSDVKIVTGLVESHFMAGISGGRKAVCPALVNTKTIEKFHGVEFLENPKSTNLNLEGNPCHEEAVEVARTVGVDFMISTTLDHDLNITGVYGGDLFDAHMEAFKAMNEFVRIPVKEPFDIVITHAGYVGRDHYQSVKAAVGAIPVVKENGFILMAANNIDVRPIGSKEYITFLHLFKMLGPDKYNAILQSPDWIFTKDQWEPEMWGKPVRKVGSDHLIYCAPQLTPEDYTYIPGLSAYEMIEADSKFASDREKAETMLQNAVIYAVNQPAYKGKNPTVGFVVEGPYSVPMLD